MNVLNDFVLELDFMTTTEFCAKYNIPPPKLDKNDLEKSALDFLRIDAIKWKMVMEYAKNLRSIKTPSVSE